MHDDGAGYVERTGPFTTHQGGRIFAALTCIITVCVCGFYWILQQRSAGLHPHEPGAFFARATALAGVILVLALLEVNLYARFARQRASVNGT